MTPFDWRDRVNLSVKVGLGTGSKEQQLILLNAILQRQLQAIQLQQNVYGPVVNLKNIYSTLQKLVENAGLGSVEPFFMDPEVGAAQMPQLPPKPPTEFEKVSLAQVQGENQRAILDSEVQMKKMESALRQKLLDFELQVKEMELKYGTKINELEMKNRSMVEQQQVRQSGDLFKEIMKGQKQFFNGKGSKQTDFGGEKGPATAGRTPDERGV